MNVATLEAALPALTETLLTEITSTAQVLVADEPQGVRRSDFHVLWRFRDEVDVPGAGGLGRPMHGLRYVFEVRDGSATQSARRSSWPLELRAGLHHRRKPLITGLDHAEVLAVVVEPAEGVNVAGGSGAVLGQAEVLFVGDVLVEDEAPVEGEDE